MEDDSIVLQKLKWSRGERLVFQLRSLNGRRAIDIRRFTLNEDDEWVPTKKGIWVPLERLLDFERAFHSCVEAIRGKRTQSVEAEPSESAIDGSTDGASDSHEGWSETDRDPEDLINDWLASESPEPHGKKARRPEFH